MADGVPDRGHAADVAYVSRTVSSGTTQLQVVEFSPAKDAGLRPLLFLPALGAPVEYYEPLLAAWAARGRHVFGLQLRGQPTWPPKQLRRQNFGYRELIRQDLPAVFAAHLWDQPPVLVGHSLGGQLALLATAAHTVAPHAVVTIASGTSSVRTGSRSQRFRRRAAVALVRSTSRALGYWPGDHLGFGGRQPRTVMHDWSEEARTGRYALSGDTTDYNAALTMITPPMLILDIAGDQLLLPSAVDHLADRLPPHHTRQSITAGAADHFSWARRDPNRAVQPIENWLSSSAPYSNPAT